MKSPVALTIGGSDSGGGAGIQADLKTFAALQIHGTSVITCVTAQNTQKVIAIQNVEPDIVRAQIRAVLDDIGINAAKTGMLYRSDIIHVVAEELRRNRLPLTVDPVMVAKSGDVLLENDAKRSLIEEILPLATVITPNAMETEVLSKIRPKTVDEARRAAKIIGNLGPKAVVVKGGHIPTAEDVVDVLYLNGEYTVFRGRRLDAGNTHGTGCTFASAITAELAKGTIIVEAVRLAKDFVSKAIRWGMSVGKGVGPVNPLATLFEEAEKYCVLSDLRNGIRLLEECNELHKLVPESQINLGMALTKAEEPSQVAAIPGRIVKIKDHVRASSCPEFGVSGHIASTILTAMKFDYTIRAAVNIKHSVELVEICRKAGFRISEYDRKEEPDEVKRIEGKTTGWGAERAIRQFGSVPDIIFHTGDYGKEAMMVFLGKSATEVAGKVIKIAELSGCHASNQDPS